MVFNSYTFLLFFAAVLALYYGPLQGRWRGQKWLLLVASYLFYAVWNPPFVALLWLSTVVDWFVARAMARSESSRRRKSLLAVTLGVNLGLLGFFKYGNFFLENFVALMSAVGVNYQPPELDIFLPIGISFYTFQTLSYTLDIYWRRSEPSDSFLDYALYVTFFPQLVAGPIVRATDFLPQCKEPPSPDARRFTWGMILMVVGLFSKVVIADALLAPIADQTFENQGAFGFVDAWVGTLSFAGQIYSDFAGYSIGAIGAALCLGFALPDNFRHPYGAIGFSEFWRKWHISLSEWLRDYVYIPLGGNRQGKTRTYVNLMLTMLVGGLWHGAAWTFVLWGALHGGYLMLERFLKHQWGDVSFWRTRAGRAALLLGTFTLVCIAWVPFRATSFEQAWSMLAAMVGLGAGFDHGSHDVAAALAVMAAMVGHHAYMRRRSLEDVARKLPWWAISLAVAVMLYLMITVHGDDRAFIYFQF
jgi:D-alanyl-lipoteichoic acid acyltransferase DltB (MBOAT superfamily)